MDNSLIILNEQLKNLKEDYNGLVAGCANILEFSNFSVSPQLNVHNKPLAKNINNKIKKLYKNLLITESEIMKL